MLPHCGKHGQVHSITMKVLPEVPEGHTVGGLKISHFPHAMLTGPQVSPGANRKEQNGERKWITDIGTGKSRIGKGKERGRVGFGRKM